MPHTIGGRTLLSLTEARERFDLSQNYLGLLLRDGKVEGFKLGSIWHVYADSIEAFLSHPRKPGPKGPRKKSDAAESVPS